MAFLSVIISILQVLVHVATWIILIQAILSWLLAFNVINTYNETVRQIWEALKKITEPVYRPIRRILPDFGALDLSPLVVLLILYIFSTIILPAIAFQVGTAPTI